MAQTTQQDPQAAYQAMGRSQSSELRRSHSSHWSVPADLHVGDQSDASVRNAFLRKVYGIVGAQMALTVVVSVCMMLNPSIRALAIPYFQSGLMQWAIFIPTLVVLFVLQCKKNDYPLNFQLLFVFTLLMSVDIGFVCAIFYEAGLGLLIAQAVSITAVIFFALSAYTLKSDRDFSFLGAYLFAALIGLIFVGFLAMFIPAIRANILYPVFGALVFCGYIVFDTWKINKVFGPDDYIIAAIELYLDILNLFLYILQILADRK